MQTKRTTNDRAHDRGPGAQETDATLIAQRMLDEGPGSVCCLIAPEARERRGIAHELCRRVTRRQGRTLCLDLAGRDGASTLSLVGTASNACQHRDARLMAVVLGDLPTGDTDYLIDLSDHIASMRDAGALVLVTVGRKDEAALDWVGRHTLYEPGAQAAPMARKAAPTRPTIARIPPYITVEQSAYLLAVSPALVRKLVATGEITEACRIGSLLRIRTRPFLDRFDIPLEEAYEAVGGHAGGSM